MGRQRTLDRPLNARRQALLQCRGGRAQLVDVRLGSRQDRAQVGHGGPVADHIPTGLVAAGARPQLLDTAIELRLRLFHRGATALHRRQSTPPRPGPLVPSMGRLWRFPMHAHDDDVSYTRIIDPAPAGEDLALPVPGDQPSLVWRPRLGEDQIYALDRRLTKLGRHAQNDVVLAVPTVAARHAAVRAGP